VEAAAVFEAGEFFSGGTNGFDGRVVGGGVLAEDVEIGHHFNPRKA